LEAGRIGEAIHWRFADKALHARFQIEGEQLAGSFGSVGCHRL
jgi:hypothetical protein